MRKMLLTAALLLTVVVQSFAQYPSITIRQLNQMPLDSLLLADTLQNTQPSRYFLQTSPRWSRAGRGDTVTITGIIVVPAKVLTFTNAGYDMLLCDTLNAYPWGGVFVRGSSDTLAHIADGMLNYQRGDVVTMTGVISEFPTNNMNSLTQFQPIPNKPITKIGTKPVPGPLAMTIGDFYRGLFPGGTVRYSTGEPLEGLYVELTNLKVDSKLNTDRGTFTMVDLAGNQISIYDASKFFTRGHGTIIGPPDTTWQRVYDNLPIGIAVDTIRGYITTVSGSEAPRGYRITPVFRSDLKFGTAIPPTLSSHRRNPVLVTSSTSPTVSVKAASQPGGARIDTVRLWYSVGTGAFVKVPMTFQAVDTTYVSSIPAQAVNSGLRYFFTATDTAGLTVTYASSASGAFASDTSKGYFFYTVLDRPLTIQDVQTTNFKNGRSGYIGADVTLQGIVTADTASIGLSPLNIAGTSSWYIQRGVAKWSGIWVAGTDTMLLKWKVGDSVSVTGRVQEQFEVTRLYDTTNGSAIVRSSSNPVPAPVALQTSAFGPNATNGSATAEPYEGMLVRLDSVRVTSIDPVFTDITEFEVADKSNSPVIVRRDGRNTYSNLPADSVFGKTILRVPNKLTSLTGVIYFSFNRYKIVPRKNTDFGILTSVEILRGDGIADRYTLEQNYPNPFNPSTVIEYSVPTTGIVSLRIFNILGQEVKSLVNDVQPAGRYTVRFDASGLSTGVYFYQLQAGSFTQVRKMLLLK